MLSRFCKGGARSVSIVRTTKDTAGCSSASEKASIKVACSSRVEKSHRKWRCWKERQQPRDPTIWQACHRELGETSSKTRAYRAPKRIGKCSSPTMGEIHWL